MNEKKFQVRDHYVSTKAQKHSFEELINILNSTKEVSNKIRNLQDRFNEELLNDNRKDVLDSLKDDRTKLKSQLNVCSFSSSTEDNMNHSKDNIVEYNNHIILDYDLYDYNLYGEDFFEIDRVKDLFNKICKDELIKFGFISPSGGIKLIIEYDSDLDNTTSYKIKEEEYKEVFNFLSEYFRKNYSIKTDKSGVNINRLCFLASEFDPYYSKGNVILPIIPKHNDTNDDLSADMFSMKSISSLIKKTYPETFYIELIDIIKKNRDMITGSYFEEYHDWINLGWSCISDLGENGRKYFHILSSLGSNYDKKQTDVKFDNLLKTFDDTKSGLSYKFIHNYCKNNNLISSDDIKGTNILKKADNNLKYKASDLPDIMNNLIGIKIYYDTISDLKFFEWDWYYQREKGSSLLTFYDEKNNKYLMYNKNRLKKSIYTEFNTNYSAIKKESITDYFDSTQGTIRRNFALDKFETYRNEDPSEFKKMCSFVGVQDDKNELKENIIKRWMLGTFINSFTMNYYDEILVLKGGQGLGKTTWIMEYFLGNFKEFTTSNFSWDIEKKRSDVEALTKKLFIYDSENKSLKKAETEIIKSITSLATIDSQVLYSQDGERNIRRASFIFDTNKDVVFNDETGGRRYLILPLTSLNIYDNKPNQSGELKKIDYKKVWGYIYHLWKTGVKFNSIDISDIKEWREESQLVDDITELIEEIFETTNEDIRITSGDATSIIIDYIKVNGIKLNSSYSSSIVQSKMKNIFKENYSNNKKINGSKKRGYSHLKLNSSLTKMNRISSTLKNFNDLFDYSYVIQNEDGLNDLFK